MARLLAAEREAALDHLFHHVLVADRGADHLDAAIAKRDLEADVAHHRRDHGGARQPAAILQVDRRHQQDGVAVDDPAGVIDEQRAIAVAVERHAEARLRRHHRLREAVEVRRAAIEVDVAAVGRDADRLDVETRAARNSAGAIGAVAPLAQSITICEPASGPAFFMISSRCWT